MRREMSVSANSGRNAGFSGGSFFRACAGLLRLHCSPLLSTCGRRMWVRDLRPFVLATEMFKHK